MRNDYDIDATLRRYLLGQLTEEEQIDFEAKMLMEEGLADRLAVSEDELIDEYVNGELPLSSHEYFERHFLTSAERYQKLKLTRSLKKYLIAEKQRLQSEIEPVMERVLERDPAPRRSGQWRGWLLTPAWKTAFAAFLLLSIGWGVWRFFFYNSEVNKGIAALNTAFSERRPIQPRIVGLHYAPYFELRGNDQIAYNKMELDRAGSILLDLAASKPNPTSLHAVGRYYLAKGETDQAIEKFETALKTAPNNAQIHSDLGAALLEKAEIERSRRQFGEILKNYADSREHLEAALKLVPSLPEANFNLAYYFHKRALWGLAKTAWERYLEIESSSRWKEEANQYLEIAKRKLQEQKTMNNKKVLNDFLNAYRARDDVSAWDVISHNREFITGRIISWQLSQAFIDLSITDRPGQSTHILHAFHYAGELEYRKSEDRYTLDLANYYSQATPKQRLVLSQAHTLVNQGNYQFLTSKYGDALNSYISAKELFDTVGDKSEMMLADVLVGVCKAQRANKLSEKELSDYERSGDICREKNYWWLLTQVDNLVGTIRESNLQYEDGKKLVKDALKIATRINDSFGEQRNLAQLANQHRSLGDYDQSLSFLDNCLSIAQERWPGPRQMWRSHLATARMLKARQFYAAAADDAKESLRLGTEDVKDPSDPSLEYSSVLELGEIYWKQNDFIKAVAYIRRAYDLADTLSNESAWSIRKAYAALQLGHLYRQAKDFNQALSLYQKSIELHQQQNAQVKLYEALKGRFQCYISQNQIELAKSELSPLLEFAEKHRDEIIEEHHRYTFFDLEQNFYDSVIDFLYSHSKDDKSAFEISEASRARSLLDFIKRGGKMTDRAAKPHYPVSQPFKTKEILGRLSDETQIVQYAVLDDKLLIWFISKSKFESREVSISKSELDSRISSYINLLSTYSSDEADIKAQGQRVYSILIKPVESLISKERPLFVIPDKILNRLPFSTIFSPTTGRYLVSDYTVSYAPSTTIYIICSENAKEKDTGRNESLLSIGNPDFDRKRFDAKKFPDLPSSADEAKTIGNLTHEETNSRCYSSSLTLIGPEARKQRIKNEAHKFNVLHFASHYEVDAVSPMRSKLLLARDWEEGAQVQSSESAIEAREIYQMDLSLARLAILSACQTGGERYYSGEGMIGISRVFIAGGVPLVIASLWPVDSNATSKLMISFHKHRKCLSVFTSEALRQAQLEILNSQSRTYRHPFYWGAFVPVGGQTTY